MTRKGKVLAASCLMYFLFYMDRVNISSLAPIIGKELQLNAFDLGMVFSALNFGFGMAGIISTLVIGGLVEWTGNWSLAFSTSIAVLACGLAATLVVGRRMGLGTAAAGVETVSA